MMRNWVQNKSNNIHFVIVFFIIYNEINEKKSISIDNLKKLQKWMGIKKALITVVINYNFFVHYGNENV